MDVMQKVALILLVMVLPFLSCGKGTDPEPPEQWPQNPNLELLTKPHDPGGERFWECVSPVWSPDGSRIYYIESRGEWSEDYYHKGDIWVIDNDGGNAESIIRGEYVHLAISPSGDKVATVIREYTYGFPGGTLVVIDLNSVTEDTVPMPNTSAFVADVEFMPTGDQLVYYAMYGSGHSDPDDGFYLYDFADSTTTLLFNEEWTAGFGGFDISPDGEEIVTVNKIRRLDGSGERVLQVGGVWPEFSPDGEKIISVSGIGSYLLGGPFEHLVDAVSGELISELDLQTHELSTSAFFAWSSDGGRIVFASKPWGGDNQRGDFELWILNEVE